MDEGRDPVAVTPDLTTAVDWPEVAPTPEQVAYVVESLRRLDRVPGGCFMNCQTLVLYKDPARRLTYVEGAGLYASSLPALHAWVVLDDSVVIDPTWRICGAPIVGTWTPEPFTYVGVRVDLARVRENMERTRTWGSVLVPPVPPLGRGRRKRSRTT